MKATIATRPVGVFDSGVGGLTVLKALQAALPNEDLLYLGDTARVPYGTKSAASVTRYAEQAAQALVDQQVKALVVACNTASAVAIEPLQALHGDLPVIGVVDPGAKASCLASESGRIAVIGTEGTISGGAYQRAIKRFRPDASVYTASCSLLVALAEEGWTEGELVEKILFKYLDPLLRQKAADKAAIDCLVLGCTHFPVLKKAIASIVGSGIKLVDSAETTANALAIRLMNQGIGNPDRNRRGRVTFQVTDGPDRFARVAAIFFESEIDRQAIELVDIQHYRSGS